MTTTAKTKAAESEPVEPQRGAHTDGGGQWPKDMLLERYVGSQQPQVRDVTADYTSHHKANNE